MVTRSVGDVPLFANTPLGKALLQFRTYNLTSHQRAVLRGMQEGKTQFASMMVGMTPVGLLSAWLRAYPQYADEARRALVDLRIEYLQTKTDLASGLELGRLNVQRNQENVGGRAASAYQSEWQSANGPMQDLQDRAAALKQLMQDDPIHSGTYAQRMRELGIEALQLSGEGGSWSAARLRAGGLPVASAARTQRRGGRGSGRLDRSLCRGRAGCGWPTSIPQI